MDRAERDRIEALARRTALEVLHAAGITGYLEPEAAGIVARAISETVAAVLADHDARREEAQQALYTTILVNGRRRTVQTDVLTYDGVLYLAGLPSTAVATVTYGRGPHGAEGELVRGESVEVRNGMVFDAVVTSNT